MRQVVTIGLLLLLPWQADAFDPNAKPADCNWTPYNTSGCIPNYDPVYRDCYRGSSPKAIIDACTAWLAKDPLDAEAVRSIAYQHRGLGNYDEAIVAFSKAIEMRPRFAYTYFDRGLAWEMKGDKARAIADFRKCLELAPRFPRALEGLKRLGTSL